MENISKPRILYVKKILEERSDENNPISTFQLIDILRDDYGIQAHRTSIYKDIEALKEYGADIETIHSTQSKYFIAGRNFELPELKLLVDAVESSKFITDKKSRILINKICSLTSRGQVESLKRNNYVFNRIKPSNEKIYYIVDRINDAINTYKKIAFQYYEYNEKKCKVKKNKGEVYVISPYKMVWNGDFYYVLGYSQKHEKIVTFRVDRIADTPDILDEDALPLPKDFDLQDYLQQVFLMYDGETKKVWLSCEKHQMKTIIDRFGENVKITQSNESRFTIEVLVSVSPTFFGWIFGFCGQIKIIGPQDVANQYKELVRKSFEYL